MSKYLAGKRPSVQELNNMNYEMPIHCYEQADERLKRLLGFLANGRSEEHTSELQSQFRISYAVFCLKKKTPPTPPPPHPPPTSIST